MKIAGLIILPLFCSLLIVFNANAQALPKKFREIKTGTSEVDVIKLVGNPTRVERFVTVKNNTYDTSRYWRYNDVTIVFTNHAVEKVETKWEMVLKHIQQYANRKDNDGINIITSE
jgi:hypothetical protein